LLSSTATHLQRTVDCLDSCVVLLDTSKPGLEIVFTNVAYTKVTGVCVWGYMHVCVVGPYVNASCPPLPGASLPAHFTLQQNAMLPWYVWVLRHTMHVL